jgi:hypothetical protein
MTFELFLPSSETASSYSPSNRDVVINMCSLLLKAISANDKACSFKDFTQLSLFLELLKRADPKLRDQILLGQPIPEVSVLPEDVITSVSQSSAEHLVLAQQLKDALEARTKPEEGNNKYEIVNEFEGIKQGLFPVDMAIKKNDQILGFVEVDGPFHYRFDKESGKQKLRRLDQLKETLYHHDYPKIPFIRISSRTIRDNDSSLSSSILSQIEDI